MKFTDILALAKQGYTPSDIKELLSIETDQHETKEEAPTEPAPVPVIEQEQTSEPAAEDQGSGAETDAQAERIKELEAQIKALQVQNTRQRRPEQEAPVKSQKEVLEDLARKFM